MADLQPSPYVTAPTSVSPTPVAPTPTPPPPRRGWLRGGIIVALAVAVVAAVLAFLWPRIDALFTPDPINQNVANGNQPGGTNPDGTRIPATANERDQQRYADVNLLRLQLASYFKEHKDYPTVLADMVPKHAVSIPKDPLTGTEYAYAKGELTFTISFTLEDGFLLFVA